MSKDIKRSSEPTSNMGGCLLEGVGLTTVLSVAGGLMLLMSRDNGRSYSPEITKVEVMQTGPYSVSIVSSEPITVGHPRINRILREIASKCEPINMPQDGSTSFTELPINTKDNNCSTKIDLPQ